MRLSKILWFVSGKQIRSIVCWSQRLRQKIDLWGADKSWYVAIKDCSVIGSLSLFSNFNHFLAAQGINLPFFSRESGSNYAQAEYYLQQNTFRWYYAWETIICRQLFAGCSGWNLHHKGRNLLLVVWGAVYQLKKNLNAVMTANISNTCCKSCCLENPSTRLHELIISTSKMATIYKYVNNL